jgi:beta-lactam-binding protein with PASTA domain
MGSKIDLVLGSGTGETQFNVPGLIGMTFGEAKARLLAFGINLLPLSAPGVTDTLGAYIVAQDPPKYDQDGRSMKIRSGQLISVWLSMDKPSLAPPPPPDPDTTDNDDQ